MWTAYNEGQDLKRNKPPIVLVSIGGPGVNSQHVDTPCGNQCPFVNTLCCGWSQMPKHMRWITGFVMLYLQNRTDWAPIFWQNDNDIILSGGGVAEVRRNSRVFLDYPEALTPASQSSSSYTFKSRPATLPVRTVDTSLNAAFDAGIITNTGGKTSTFTPVLTKVDGPCDEVSFVDSAMSISGRSSGTLQLLIGGIRNTTSPSSTASCDVTYYAANESEERGTISNPLTLSVNVSSM